MEKRIIKIPQGAKIGPEQKPIYGYMDVVAYCKDGLSVHKSLGGKRWKWTVTHEASGLSLDVIGANTKRDAAANMEKALELGFDWSRSEEGTVAALKENRGIYDALRKIGERY